MTNRVHTSEMVFKEPTYQLHLSSETSFPWRKVKAKERPYKNLDAVVDKVMQERYTPDELRRLSSSKRKDIRKQIAHSLMNRFDQKSTFKIQLPWAKQQGLVEAVKMRLLKVAPNCDVQSLAELVFCEIREENFGFILNHQIKSAIGTAPLGIQKKIYTEICQIRRELSELGNGTTQFFRPPQTIDGISYIDHHGEEQTLTHLMPSSADRDHPDIGNGRFHLDHKGHIIYSTGRIETERKARQAVTHIIQQTLDSGQIKLDQLQHTQDVYHFPIVIENLLSTDALAKKEKEYVLQEDKILESLSQQEISFTLRTGNVIKIKPQLIHFSTPTNYNFFVEQSSIGEEITKKGLQSLEKHYNLTKMQLPDGQQKAVEQCLEELKDCSNPRDRFILRAFICEILNIPYHVHCKSSKDRTAVVVAMRKGLHLWMSIEMWKGNSQFSSPREFFNNPHFREYTEAAFFEVLPLTDQGVGFTGVLDGKLYSQNRGFRYERSMLENPFPSFVLSSRHLYKAPMVERILYTGMMAVASVIIASVYTVLFPLVLTSLYYFYRKDALQISSHLILCLTLLPFKSSFRKDWIKRDSPTLQERRFILEKKPTESFKAPPRSLTLLQLEKMIDTLSPEHYQQLLGFLHKSDPTLIQVQRWDGTAWVHEVDEQMALILKEMANQWENISHETHSYRLGELVNHARTSKILLFKMLEGVTTHTVKQVSKINFYNLDANQVEKDFNTDFHRSHIMVQTPHGNKVFGLKSPLKSCQDFLKSLKQLSLPSDLKSLPIPLQAIFPQQTSIFPALNEKICNFFLCNLRGPKTGLNRLLIVEKDKESLLVHQHETALLFMPDDPETMLGSVQYHSTFKYEKEQSELHSIDKIKFKFENISPFLVLCEEK